MWEVLHYVWPSCRGMAKQTGDSKSGLPQKHTRFENARTPHRSVAAGISNGSIDFLKCWQSATTYSISGTSLVQVRFQLECLLGRLLGRLWSLESLFLVLVIPVIVVAAWPKVGDRPHDANLNLTKTEIRKYPDLDKTRVTRSFAALLLISSW